ncbi:MAG: response regulator receiver protein [Clostridiaceae bacterium]|nr:response regulator receiver protein [Clostridiaceae bacterium]
MIAEKNNSPDATPKITIHTLGSFEICRNNECVYLPSAKSTKLWDLFKFLLANKGMGMPPETILENLYPDENYENPKNTLQNLVYRLRKLLNGEEIFSNYGCNILFSNGCYSLYIPDDIALDTDIFEQYLHEADIHKYECLQKTADCLEKAISLYRGDYFPELVYEDWVIPKRNYYRRLFTQAVNDLTNIYKQKKEYDDSIRICEKAIQIEPYEEEFHISLMESLIEKGKISEARKHYGYITSLLYKQFGIKPTVEMQRIYHTLKDDRYKIDNGLTIDEYVEDENKGGAFYCDPKVFRSLFIIEKRRNERANEPVLPVSFNFEGKDNSDINANSSIFIEFRKFLIKSLRKGDVVTTWNDRYLLVLLPRIDYKGVRVVTDRIIKQFQSNYNCSDFDIKVKFHTFLP